MNYVVIDCPDCDGVTQIATFPVPACTTCTGLGVVRISEDHLPVYIPPLPDSLTHNLGEDDAEDTWLC